VFSWNYRAYGWSKGTPDPYNARTDAESVYHFLRDNLGITKQIGVYGRSLGGLPCCHLAAKFSPDISMLIADRTFASLKMASQKKFPGSHAECLFDIFSLKWESDNYKNFYNAKCKTKVALIDPLDDVVD